MTVQELYDRIGGSYESVKRILPSDQLIGRFVVKFTEDKSAERLFAALKSGDAAGIFESAHTMKGVCANLGLNALSEAASAITEEFRPGKARTMSDGELARRTDALKEAYERALAGIREFAASQA